ncbi:hypothetical protein [Kitasatospora phosalacinea]|uniref:Uncharacterized protein n=1 Tax=Kitasatospora phosalacinea TaxID=2065 RepID=A0ABW6GDL6_9ACTN
MVGRDAEPNAPVAEFLAAPGGPEGRYALREHLRGPADPTAAARTIAARTAAARTAADPTAVRSPCSAERTVRAGRRPVYGMGMAKAAGHGVVSRDTIH